MLVILSFFIPAILIIVGIFVAITVIKAINKKTSERPRQLSLEKKLILLNNQLSAGTITKEDYDKQKAELLKNI